MTLLTPKTPPLLSLGFRIFFLGAGLWACASMLLWLGFVTGWLALPGVFDPVSWHAHAFLFGFVSAVVAGFLLTAVPNWTGRPPLVGLPLLALALWWMLGRALTTISLPIPAHLVALVDVSFLLVLALIVARELVQSGNRRNLIVVAALLALALANGRFHIQAYLGEPAYRGEGLRLGVSATLMLIMIVGGRIVPNFTRNWLKQTGALVMPAPAMQRFDQITLAASMVALLAWTFLPDSPVSAILLLALGVLNAIRLVRWQGLQTGTEPLVAVLHIAYALVPLGAVTIGVATLAGAEHITRGAQHIWMAGAIGLMCLAVMTRATLGHSGQPLKAGAGTMLIYASILGAVGMRFAAALVPAQAVTLWTVSGLLWLVAFALFVGLFGPLMLRARS